MSGDILQTVLTAAAANGFDGRSVYSILFRLQTHALYYNNAMDSYLRVVTREARIATIVASRCVFPGFFF